VPHPERVAKRARPPWHTRQQRSGDGRDWDRTSDLPRVKQEQHGLTGSNPASLLENNRSEQPDFPVAAGLPLTTD
jgi:hypothetical protein